MPFKCHIREDGIFVCAAVGVIKSEDVPELREAEQKFFRDRPNEKARFLCDCSTMKVISPEAADVLLGLMKEDTPRLHRAAFVVAEGVNALQLRRMIREVGSPKRQTFVDLGEAVVWLNDLKAK